MSDSRDAKADCYSEGERAAMGWTQELRGWLLAPLLKFMTRWGVRPDHLTFLSLVCGLAFCPLYHWSPPLAFLAILLHVLLDGIDGPLARHTSVASRRGSFTDTMADQIVVIAVTVTLMAAPDRVIGIAAGSLYIVLYTVVVAFAMIRNALEIPYSWVVRPRFIVYGWLLIETYLLPGSIDYVLWICNALLAAKMISGFARIRAKI